MFDIGLQEIIVIGVIALLVFGPSKLPELSRMVGRALREFRRASEEFRSTVETNLHLNDPDTDPAGSAADPTSTAMAGDVAISRLPSETEPALTREMITTLATVDIAQPTEPFCAQIGSRLFHRRECSGVGRIREGARVNLKSVADARAQGYLTCPVCEPWEPV
jgi:TatA/E family protein of Tat protein translocase